MAPQKTKGIVLKSRDYTETSKLVSILSPDGGLLRTLAKGSRRPASPLRGKLEVFNYGDLIFYPSRTSDLHILAQFDVIEHFPAARATLERSALFQYLAELAASAAYGEENSRELFKLLLHTLQNAAVINAIPPSRLWFEIRYLNLLGVLPPFDRCSRCRGALGDGVRFFLPELHWLCPGCGQKYAAAVLIEPGVMSAIRYINKSGLVQVVNLRLSERQSSIADRLLCYLVDSTVDKKLKSRRFLDQISNKVFTE
ncbi:MAG: DNA repair protein RecO [PVC group bacterium]